MLVRWHLDPEVARFWDGHTFTAEEMAARMARPHVDAYIVEAAGEAVRISRRGSETQWMWAASTCS